MDVPEEQKSRKFETVESGFDIDLRTSAQELGSLGARHCAGKGLERAPRPSLPLASPARRRDGVVRRCPVVHQLLVMWVCVPRAGVHPRTVAPAANSLIRGFQGEG